MADRPKVEDVWALLRFQFPEHGSLLAIVPWGGDRAVLVTQSAVYVAWPDELSGFTISKVVDR